MFICTELIEQTGRPPGLIFGGWGFFWRFMHLTELRRICHIFVSVKNHINAYISRPIRDRNVKT